MNKKGVSYGFLGDYDNGLKFQLEALKMRQNLYKGDHPDVANSLINVGLAFENIGDYESDLKYQLEALRMCRSLYNENHPYTASALNNVGTCYVCLGKAFKLILFEYKRQC